MIKRGKKQNGDSVEASGNRWRIAGGWGGGAHFENRGEQEPRRKKGGLAVRVSLMKPS